MLFRSQDLPCISLSNLGCFLDSNWPQWRHAFPGSIQLRQVIESVLLREFFGFCLYLSPSHNSHPEYYVGREELPKKTRSMLNLAMISTLNRPHELKMHVKGAIRNGVSREEIREVFLQVAVYAGVPAAVDSFRTAGEIFAELDEG